jgi:lysophospholipase L1-like esterase
MTPTTFWSSFVLALCAALPAQAADEAAPNLDWPGLALYQKANAALAAPAANEARVVFMGDSITEFWDKPGKALFANKAYVNRGVSGQTSSQMLVRFRQDVIALQPQVVVILAGTNDIAGNTGPVSNASIAGHIASMAELARAHGIRVVLAALLPANAYYWAPELKPAERVVDLNRLIKAYAERHGLVHLDYFTPMVDERLGLKRAYSDDGVHPNAAGYALMQPLVEQAIANALKQQR